MDKRDDLEAVLLCAQASEVWKTAHEWYPTMTLDSTFAGAEIRGDAVYLIPNNPMRQDPRIYDPLHDDAQAMALVKRFRLEIDGGYDNDRFDPTGWAVEHNDYEKATQQEDLDLNRAIVYCVAAMQRARGG